MTTGDAGNSSSSQNTSSLSGKLLRINLDGSVPNDNPTPDSYIYTSGHRNAQGLAYGPNGQLYSSEHGAQASDEVNLIEPNRNYGWPNVQGACNTNSEINFCNNFNVKEPLIEWSPCIAVCGIDYYDHEAIPEWKGKMLMAILVGDNPPNNNRLAVLEFNEDGTDIVGEQRYFGDYGRLRDVCINPHNGAIFMATNGENYPGFGPNRIIEYRNLDYEVTSVTEPSTTQFMNVFPNPTSTQRGFSVQFSENFFGSTFELIAFTGQIVHAQKIINNTMNVSTKNLSAGNYYIKATNGEGTITRKVVVQ